MKKLNVKLKKYAIVSDDEFSKDIENEPVISIDRYKMTKQLPVENKCKQNPNTHKESISTLLDLKIKESIHVFRRLI